MKSSKNLWVWVGVVVVVLVVVGALIWRSTSQQPANSGPAAVYAPQGQLAPGFPKNLVLDAQARIGSSYSIAYASTTNQYTARWVSSSSVATLYNSYKTYFGNNGWAITNSSGATSTSKLGAIYAATSSANVSVTMITQGKGSEITVSYVGHQ
jgi:hypothetical protein